MAFLESVWAFSGRIAEAVYTAYCSGKVHKGRTDHNGSVSSTMVPGWTYLNRE